MLNFITVDSWASFLSIYPSYFFAHGGDKDLDRLNLARLRINDVSLVPAEVYKDLFPTHI